MCMLQVTKCVQCVLVLRYTSLGGDDYLTVEFLSTLNIQCSTGLKLSTDLLSTKEYYSP